MDATTAKSYRLIKQYICSLLQKAFLGNFVFTTFDLRSYYTHTYVIWEGQINTWFEILDAYDFEIERRTSHHMEMLMQCHRDLFRINIVAIVAGLSNDVR
jgi:hypothetical protein